MRLVRVVDEARRAAQGLRVGRAPAGEAVRRARRGAHSRRAEDWARFFWRAHNFVNEQTQVTRCGSQECGWGSWTTPAAAHEPVGVYRNPWFMTYANAEKRWKHADE